jgi:hypothetical protein
MPVMGHVPATPGFLVSGDFAPRKVFRIGVPAHRIKPIPPALSGILAVAVARLRVYYVKSKNCGPGATYTHT